MTLDQSDFDRLWMYAFRSDTGLARSEWCRVTVFIFLVAAFLSALS